MYKALVLLEYLIKTGSEKVGQQCKENIYAIQTLKDFQHSEEGSSMCISLFTYFLFLFPILLR